MLCRASVSQYLTGQYICYYPTQHCKGVHILLYGRATYNSMFRACYQAVDLAYIIINISSDGVQSIVSFVTQKRSFRNENGAVDL